jgi:putative hydrolase of the HAD superfamily
MASSIRAVLFDLGGVLCRFDPARRLAAMASATGVPAGRIQEAIWDSGFDAACDRGDYSARQAHQAFCERLAVGISFYDYGRCHAAAFRPDEAVLAVADEIAPGLSRGLLTNNGAILREALPVHFPGIVRRFKPNIFFSCDFGALKPSAELYAGVLERLARPPEAVLLIDDSQANVEGARAFGLQAVRFTGDGALRRDLAARGLLKGA